METDGILWKDQSSKKFLSFAYLCYSLYSGDMPTDDMGHHAEMIKSHCSRQDIPEICKEVDGASIT